MVGWTAVLDGSHRSGANRRGPLPTGRIAASPVALRRRDRRLGRTRAPLRRLDRRPARAPPEPLARGSSLRLLGRGRPPTGPDPARTRGGHRGRGPEPEYWPDHRHRRRPADDRVALATPGTTQHPHREAGSGRSPPPRHRPRRCRRRQLSPLAGAGTSPRPSPPAHRLGRRPPDRSPRSPLPLRPRPATGQPVHHPRLVAAAVPGSRAPVRRTARPGPLAHGVARPWPKGGSADRDGHLDALARVDPGGSELSFEGGDQRTGIAAGFEPLGDRPQRLARPDDDHLRPTESATGSARRRRRPGRRDHGRHPPADRQQDAEEGQPTPEAVPPGSRPRLGSKTRTTPRRRGARGRSRTCVRHGVRMTRTSVRGQADGRLPR